MNFDVWIGQIFRDNKREILDKQSGTEAKTELVKGYGPSVVLGFCFIIIMNTSNLYDQLRSTFRNWKVEMTSSRMELTHFEFKRHFQEWSLIIFSKISFGILNSNNYKVFPGYINSWLRLRRPANYLIFYIIVVLVLTLHSLVPVNEILVQSLWKEYKKKKFTF